MKCTVNGMDIDVQAGATVLEACRAAGVEVPTLCHNDQLKPYGSCFICVVEIEGKRSLAPSCSTPATEGMVIRTDTDRVQKARKTCVELLLSDHFGDCLGPCMSACPAGIDIPGFINHLAHGRDREALKLIKQTMPFPGALGRVCTRPCETACRRQLVEQPIAVCQLKRYPADVVSNVGDDIQPACAPPSGKKAAIVGAGPAGLSAAYFLQQMGHQCTVYEAQEAPGGMLRYGIPSYRLPRDVIDRETAVIEQMGADIQYGQRLGKDLTLESLIDRYDAVFLGLGAQAASSMRVDGEDTDGVLSGVEFLGAVSRNEKHPVGRRVMVVGGGNTAVDTARTALRLGAEEVTMLYRRTRKEMPAWEEEIEAAEHEGVTLELLAAPVRIESDQDGALKVSCIQMELGEPDASGRRRPVPITGSEAIREVDQVIAAIGQRVDASSCEDLEREAWGGLVVNEQTLQTSNPKVFAGGDCVTGPDIAVNAVAAGHRAAVSMHQWMSGRDVIGPPPSYRHSMGELDTIPAEVTADYSQTPRVSMPHLDDEKRRTTFEEVEQGFTAEQVKDEARRCMECGCRDAHECKLRLYAAATGAKQDAYGGACRTYARDESHAMAVYEEHKCIQCGTCVRLAEEVIGTCSMGFVNRGFAARVKPALGRALALVEDDGIDRLIDNCPVGALTRKTDPVEIRTA